MTKSKLSQILLFVLLLSILAWIVSDDTARRIEPTAAPQEAVVRGPEPQTQEFAGFTVTTSRPLPRKGKPLPDEVLAAARQHMKAGGQVGTCGPYTLLGEATDPQLLDSCERIASRLDSTYRHRFGVAPIGQPAASILLFSSRDSYRAFATEEGMTTAGYAGFSMPSRGYTAAWADASRAADFSKTLAHELTHLVNRRALGGNLPRWLSEGLADAIGDTATTAGIQPLAGVEGSKGEAERLRLGLQSGQVDSLARLVSLQDDDFDAEEVSFDYEQSALLVRFLLLDSQLAPGFRAFLAELAEGKNSSPELLQRHLALEWSELDAKLDTWLVGQMSR